MAKGKLIRRIALAVALLSVGVVVTISLVVEMEGEYAHENLGGEGAGTALILYHPSRDAQFSDDLSLALARGFQDAGLTVERETITRRTPARPQGYAIVAVVSNTYYWTPDRPTRRYLRRADLSEVPAIGLMGGAGSTGRADRLLAKALLEAGAPSVEVRPFWLWRPNDEARLDDPNRDIAMDLARNLGVEVGAAMLSAGALLP